MQYKRYLQTAIIKDLEKKIVLLSGPRQVGKTTLSKDLSRSTCYLNYDDVSHRMMIREKQWPRDVEILVLDELHKMKDWKRFVKGIYDLEGVTPKILVTGSSRLDLVRKMGDSLAGRFFNWRLHPFTVSELTALGEDAQASLNKLLKLSGFPEPYLSGDEEFYRRWASSHLDIIIRQDLIQLERVSDIASIETLVHLLAERVGSVVSYESLARDLDRDAATVKRWLSVLENLFVIFKVPPWSRNIAKGLKKASKYYFYDAARVRNGDGARLENLVAGALLREIHFQKDMHGLDMGLFFLRSRDGHELDFLVEKKGHPALIAEVKWSEDAFSPHFKWFAKSLDKKGLQSYQVVANLKNEKESPEGTKMMRASSWLAGLTLS